MSRFIMIIGGFLAAVFIVVVGLSLRPVQEIAPFDHMANYPCFGIMGLTKGQKLVFRGDQPRHILRERDDNMASALETKISDGQEVTYEGEILCWPHMPHIVALVSADVPTNPKKGWMVIGNQEKWWVEPQSSEGLRPHMSLVRMSGRDCLPRLGLDDFYPADGSEWDGLWFQAQGEGSLSLRDAHSLSASSTFTFRGGDRGQITPFSDGFHYACDDEHNVHWAVTLYNTAHEVVGVGWVAEDEPRSSSNLGSRMSGY